MFVSKDGKIAKTGVVPLAAEYVPPIPKSVEEITKSYTTTRRTRKFPIYKWCVKHFIILAYSNLAPESKLDPDIVQLFDALDKGEADEVLPDDFIVQAMLADQPADDRATESVAKNKKDITPKFVVFAGNSHFR